MTVTTTLDRQYFPGDGSNKNFPFNFKFFDNSQIYVYLIDPSGVVTGKTLNVDYTLSGALSAGGGQVIMNVAPLINYKILIQRKLPLTQPTSIRNQGAFFPAIHEDAFDRLTMLAQQASAEAESALQLDQSGTFWDFQGRRGVNVGSPINDFDAANKIWTRTTIAEIISGIVGSPNMASNVFYLAPKGTSAVVQDMSSLTDPAKGIDLLGVSKLVNGGIEKTLRQRFEGADVIDFAVEYLTPSEIAQLRIPYATGAANSKPTLDLTAKLLACIADAGGTADITSAYLYSPAKVIKLPAGVFGVNFGALERALINKNNINIIGAGTFNTRIVYIGTAINQEMFRFKEAYACGLAHLTLDGGLPFRPTGTETYGCEIPLVLDQCAHFYADGLNVCNFRHRGIQAIHLWESFLGTDLRIFNGGWFPASGSTAGGLIFDAFRKESTFFPGSESNQIYLGKYAFSGCGSPYSWVSPVFNMVIEQAVCECFTFGSYIPPGIGNAKVVVSGISNSIKVNHAYYYFHDQDASIGAGAVLFDFQNAGIGCQFLNQVVYQEIPAGSTGRTLELSSIFNTTSAFAVEVDVKIFDVNCSTSLFKATGTAASSMILGSVYYRNLSVRDVRTFLGTFGSANRSGKLVFSTGVFTGQIIPQYEAKGQSVEASCIDNAGFFAEYACRAINVFNGAPGGGTLMQKGVSAVRVSAGLYNYTFVNELGVATPLPDANYTVTPAILGSTGAQPGKVDCVAASAAGFSLQVRDSGGTASDNARISVTVHR